MSTVTAEPTTTDFKQQRDALTQQIAVHQARITELENDEYERQRQRHDQPAMAAVVAEVWSLYDLVDGYAVELAEVAIAELEFNLAEARQRMSERQPARDKTEAARQVAERAAAEAAAAYQAAKGDAEQLSLRLPGLRKHLDDLRTTYNEKRWRSSLCK